MASPLAVRYTLLVTRTITSALSPAKARTSILTLIVALAALHVPGLAQAQGVAANKPVRTLIGDIALILRTDTPGTLRIGVAGASRSLSLSVRATDARRWADSASRLLAPARRPRARAARASSARDTSVRQRAVLEEPGVGAGTFVLLRIDSAATRRYMLFVDDATLQGIRQPLEADEAKLLIRIVKRSATPPRAAAPAKKKSVAKGSSGDPSGGKASGSKPSGSKPPGSKP